MNVYALTDAGHAFLKDFALGRVPWNEETWGVQTVLAHCKYLSELNGFHYYSPLHADDTGPHPGWFDVCLQRGLIRQLSGSETSEFTAKANDLKEHLGRN